MDIDELIECLRFCSEDKNSCPECKRYRNSTCSSMKCVDDLMVQAAGALESLQNQITQMMREASAEKQACFRLGQMDVRESVVFMLWKAADNTYGIAHETLMVAADLVKGGKLND